MSDKRRDPHRLSCEHYEALFDDVRLQLYRLHCAWTLHICLYGSLHSVELVRRTAPITFGALQDILIQMIFIGTHRLLDESSSRGKTSASIESLIRLFPGNHPELCRQLRRGLRDARRAAEELREWRDRHIAHRDLATVLEQHPRPLESVKMHVVGNAIEYFAQALTAISRELQLNAEYDPHREMDDMDVHRLLEHLEESRTFGPPPRA